MYAASAEMTRVPTALASVLGQTCFPSGPTTFRIVWWGTSTPPFAMVPNALTMSIGWISSVPMLSDATATVPAG